MSEIEHLVLSGGGHNIIAMFGAVSFLKKQKYLDFDKITSIDATSAGSLLAFAFMMGINEDELENYIINRPWEKVFDVTPEIIFETFQKRGLFGVSVFEEILRPIVKTCGVELSITMKELYDIGNIDFYIYTTELNKLEEVVIHHSTFPDMRVVDAIYKSCAVPPLFKPDIIDDNCYLDGGIFSNYPIHCFIKRMTDASLDVNKNKIFGIKLKYEEHENDKITTTSNINEYLFGLIKKLIQHVVIHKEYNIEIPNELIIYSKGMSFETLKKSTQSQEERKLLMEEGRRYASVYHIYKEKEKNLS